MLEERAVRLAIGTMFTYQQVLDLLREHPAMTDEEALLCMEVSQAGYASAMLGTLARAVGIFAKLEGEAERERRTVGLA